MNRAWTVLSAFVAASALVLVTCQAARSPDESLETIVWGDEFDGERSASPDPRRWSFETGGHGWGNEELQCYTRSLANARLDGEGHLLIQAVRTPGIQCGDGRIRDYTSARLNSRFQFTYGTIAVRAKMPTGQGIWPAVWALGSSIRNGVSWPASGEIDMVEVIGKRPTVAHVGVHGPGYSGGAALGADHDLGTDLSLAFHDYSITWSPTEIIFMVDGRRVWRFTRSAVPLTGGWVFDRPFFLLLNVAVGGSWPGQPDSTTTWPQTMTLDYVRVTTTRQTAAAG